MGKSKIVSLTIHKIFKDKTKSNRIDIVPLGIYRSFNKRLIGNIYYAISRLLKDEDDALDIMDEDINSWKNIYSGTAKCFDYDDSYGTASISVLNTKKFEEVFIQVAVINLENCEDNTLSYWINTPEPNINYTKEQKRYELPKLKVDNTHYTN